MSVNEHEQRELLVHYRPWLRTVAAGMTTPDRVDDLAQEGWIAIWRACPRWPGNGGEHGFHVWCKTAARNRMFNVIRDEKAGKRDRRAQLLLDDLTRIVDPPTTQVAAELAYHAREIAEALDSLTERQREYVVLRFWNEWTRTELDEHFRTRNSGAMWRNSRPKLAARLAHLAVTS